MKKIFYLFLIVLMVITCRGNAPKISQSETNKEEEKEEDVDINVTFKVYASFGYLNASYKEESKRTASTETIIAKKNGVVSFLAEPMQGFEVKAWKIKNGEFSEGGVPKNNNAKVVAKKDLTVTVEFVEIKNEEDPPLPFTIESLDIGKSAHLKLTAEKYKETMNKIRKGDVNQNLESIAQTLEVSIWTKEDMKEVYINEEKHSPDLGMPNLFKASIEAPETKKEYKITLKGEKLMSVLVFSLKKVEGKVAFPEAELGLFIDEKEVSTYIYSHLSDKTEATYPLIKTKEENAHISIKTLNPLLAGKVVYGGNNYEFDDVSKEATFTVSEITENAKIVTMKIIPKKEDSYEELTWNFKIEKVKAINFVPAFLYVDDELVPNEIKENLTEETPKTLEHAGDKAHISVRTSEAQAIESVMIDGKQATFKKKSGALRFRYEAEIDNITDVEREIVIVITPKAGKNYDETTWKFKIKKIGSVDLKDVYLYVDGSSVSEEVSNNLTNEATPPTVTVNKDSVVVQVKKMATDEIESVTIDGKQATKTTETSSMTGDTHYIFSVDIENITTENKLIKIVITPKDLTKHKVLNWQFNLKK